MDEAMFFAYETGKTKFPQFAYTGDGYLLEYDNNDGLKLFVLLNNPTPYEKHCIADATDKGDTFLISFTEIEGIGFTSFRFGTMWGDCCFEPRLYNHELDFPTLTEDKGLALHIILVNPAEGGLIEGMRLIGLQHDFSQKFIDWCKEIVKKPFDKEEQKETISRIFSAYDTNALLKHSMFSWELK